MQKEDKTTILTAAFYRLRGEGRVGTKKDFAELLGIHPGSLSAAMNGNEAYLTDSLIERVRAIVPDAADGGSQTITFTRDEISTVLQHLARTVDSQQETIANLTGVLEKKEESAASSVLRR